MHEPFQIRSRRGISAASVLLLAIAAICLMAAIGDKSPVPFTFFAGCVAAAIYLFIVQPQPVTASVTADGIQVEGSLDPVLYSDIEGLTIKGEPQRSGSSVKPNRVEINHPRGTIIISKKSTPRSPEIFSFLTEKLSLASRPDLLPPALAEFYREQSEKFGSERVWAFGGRQFTPLLFQRARALHFGIALLIISLFPLLVGVIVSADIDDIFPVSIAAGIVGCIATLIGWITIGQARNGANSFGMVLAPQGIALAQKNVSGHQAWEALHGTSYIDRGHRAGIKLLIPGTNLVITDSFSSPLQKIHALIKSYLGS